MRFLENALEIDLFTITVDYDFYGKKKDEEFHILENIFEKFWDFYEYKNFYTRE